MHFALIDRKLGTLGSHYGDDVSDMLRDAETAIRATTRLMRLVRETGRRVHVLHVTTAEEIGILAANKDLATVEITPQHLTLVAPDCYERLGTLAQMNPPVRDARLRQPPEPAQYSQVVWAR